MKKLFAVALFLTCLSQSDVFSSVLPPAQDTEITILFVADPLLTPAQINSRITFLKNSWNNTPFASLFPTTVRIANGGNAVPLTGTFFVGTEEDQLTILSDFVTARSTAESLNLREQHAADVVIGLGPSITNPEGITCGSARQENWIGPGAAFVPDVSTGLDLNGWDTGYLAIVAVTGAVCGPAPEIAAHELGHLLGANHFLRPFDTPLFPTTKHRAFIEVEEIFPLSASFAMRSAVTFSKDLECNKVDPGQCFVLEKYSSPLFGDPTHRNTLAIDITARSVANYIGAGGPPEPQVAMCLDGIDNDGDSLIDSNDPDCLTGNDENAPPPTPPPSCNSTVPPYGVHGWLLQTCVFMPDINEYGSEYVVRWAHACPESVSKYEVWTSQPDGPVFFYGWDAFAPFTTAAIAGPEGRIRVRSCGPAGCSVLSGSSFLAFDICPN